MAATWAYLDETTAGGEHVSGALRGLVDRQLPEGSLEIYFPALKVTHRAELAQHGGPSLHGGPQVGDEVLCLFEDGADDDEIGCHVIGWRALEEQGGARVLHLPGGVSLSYDADGRVRLDGPDGSRIDYHAASGRVALRARSDIALHSEEGSIMLEAPQGRIAASGAGGVLLDTPGGQAEITSTGAIRLDGSDDILLRCDGDLTAWCEGSTTIFAEEEGRLAARGNLHLASAGDVLSFDATGDCHVRVDEKLMLHARGHATLQSIEGRVHVIADDQMDVNALGDLIMQGRRIRMN